METLELQPAIKKAKKEAPDLEVLYEAAFPIVARFISKMGGTFADVKDIFQDAFILYFEKSAAGTLPGNALPEAYILGISKHLWYRKFRETKGRLNIEDLNENLAVPEEYFDESNNKLLALLMLPGKKCLELLNAFYYENLGIQEIKSAFGFGSVHSASAQKYKCLEKVRTTVKAKSLTYEAPSN